MQSGTAFGVDEVAIPADLENAAAGTHQFDIAFRKLLFDPRLQLESPGSVASGVAVFNAYVHHVSPCGCAAYGTKRGHARSVAPIGDPEGVKNSYKQGPADLYLTLYKQGSARISPDRQLRQQEGVP